MGHRFGILGEIRGIDDQERASHVHCAQQVGFAAQQVL